MKIKVDFKKLVWGRYHSFNLDIELEMINWLFKTGLDGDGFQEQHGWYRSGINQLLYGYSGNDEVHHTEPFPIHDYNYLKVYTTSIFVRAFIAPYSHAGFPAKINQWREKNKISINNYRFFNFPDPPPRDPYNFHDFELSSLIWRINEYKGKELKKEFAHPEYPNRTHPKIIAVEFSTYGAGYYVSISFSFWEFNYEPGWNELITEQQEGEYIGVFLKRTENRLKEIAIDTETDDRARFESENNFLDFAHRSCFSCTWLEKPPECGLMEHRGIKNFAIDSPENHLCDEWRLRDYINTPGGFVDA
jgi:hypothetical protein